MSCDTIPVKACAALVRSPVAERDFQSCPRLRQGSRAFCPYGGQSLHGDLPQEGSMAVNEAGFCVLFCFSAEKIPK